MMQKTLFESKNKNSYLTKISLGALQTQMKLFEQQEWTLILGLAFLGGALRVAMQSLPNIEPITVVALLSGALFGRYKGAIVGASAVWGSNFFVMGGQGPWGLFQAIAFAGVGFLGGFIGKKVTVWKSLGFAIVASIWFDIVMNFSWSLISGMNPLVLFMTGAPFTVAHVASNLVFAGSIPYLFAHMRKKGKFDEKELCKELLSKVKNQRS